MSEIASAETALVETALAKVNLSLRVVGCRTDGYHELESVVAFATAGDRLSLAPGPAFALHVDGPFQTALAGENLVTKAVRLTAEAAAAVGGRLLSGHIQLTKTLPVAAGLGGGSADAAAALRLLQRANPGLAGQLDWPHLALQLGADVPVCLISRANLMTGIGERLFPIANLPPAAILLANPRVPLSTADVFRALAARAVAGAAPASLQPLAQPPAFRDFEHMIAVLQASGNDLEPVALRLCPPVGEVLACLARLPGARLVRMSGSGPTCFAVFATVAAAAAAAEALRQSQPIWWIAAASLQ